MNKKKLFIVVLAVLCIASLTLAACQTATVTSIAIKTGSFEAKYVVGSNVSYANAKLVVKYSDNSQKEVALTADMVTPAISTAAVGTYTHTATYEGKTCNFTITVVNELQDMPEIMSVKLPDSYLDYLSRTNEEHLASPKTTADYQANLEKYDAYFSYAAAYEVGNVNAFVFQPEAGIFDENDNEQLVTGDFFKVDISVKNTANSNYALLTEANLATYVTYDAANNYYWFTEQAVDKYFRLSISLDADKVTPMTNTVLTAEIKVVEGYNVYDAEGLSVFDNLKVKNWAAKKDKQLDWDTKKLSEYTDVTRIILHNDVEILPTDLPSTYFWTGKEDAFTSLVNNIDNDGKHNDKINPADVIGSLRDGQATSSEGSFNFAAIVSSVTGTSSSSQNAANNRNKALLGDCFEDGYNVGNNQKGIYSSSGCDVSGNFMTVSISEDRDSETGLVLRTYYGEGTSNGNAMSHWSLFQIVSIKNVGKHEIKNLHVYGNQGHKESSGPAGIIAFNMWLEEISLNNIIVQQVNIANALDKLTNINIIDSKISDVANQMNYQWRSTSVIVNSVLHDCGGPLFILCDSDRTVTSSGSFNPGVGTGEGNSPSPELYADTYSILENWVLGTEAWFVNNNAAALATQVKAINSGVQYFLGHTFLAQKSAGEMFNCVAVIIPEPEDITNSSLSNGEERRITGRFVRGTGATKAEIAAAADKEIIDVNDTMLDTPFIPYSSTNISIRQAGSALYVSNGQYAFNSDASTITELPIASHDWTKASDLLGITTKLGGPYISIVFGGVKPVA